MRLEQTFDVQAPLDEVWEALTDLERVAPCLPGAAIHSHDEEGTYHGTFTVKLGPMTAAYNGTIRVEDIDQAAHTATLKAKGTDKRGQGGANATIVNTLREHEGGTRVEAVTDFNITGRLAQFGRGGMMQDVSNRLLRDFAACLSTRLAEPAAAAPVEPSGAEAVAGDAEPGAVAAAGTTPASTPPPAATPPAATPPSAAPVKGFSLFFSILWERVKRFFSRLFRRG